MSLCKSYSCSEVEAINALPSIEKPFKLPKIYVAEGFDTVQDENGNIGFGVYVPNENQIYVAGDVEDEIRARVLFHEVCHWVQAMCGRPFDEDEANEFSDIVYDALPSAQPEPSIPISWLEKEISWLKNMDNGFSNIAAMNISVLVKKWRKENAKDNRQTAQSEIIRCKDCKFYSPMNRETKTGICNLTMHQNFGDNWFCAGAERRTDE